MFSSRCCRFVLLAAAALLMGQKTSHAFSPPVATTTTTRSLLGLVDPIRMTPRTTTRAPSSSSFSLAMVSSYLGGSGDASKKNMAPLQEPLEVIPPPQSQAAPTASSLPIWAGRALVLTAAATYGTNFGLVKQLNQALPSVGISALLRFSLAATVVTSAVLWNEWKQDHHEKDTERDIMVAHSKDEETVLQLQSTTTTPKHQLQEQRNKALLFGMEVGTWYSFGYLVQALGLLSVDASKSAFLSSLSVLVVPLLDVLFKGRQVTWSMVLSVTLAIFGVALFQDLGSHGATSFSKGDILCLMQTVFFGIGWWRLETASRDYQDHAARITAGQLIGVAVAFGAYCAANGDLDASRLATVQTALQQHADFVIPAVLWTGLISTAFSIYLETIALRVVSASELVLLMTTISLWGSAFAYVTMGEVISPMGAAGGACILSGCLVSASSNSGSDKDGEMAKSLPPEQQLQLLYDKH